MVYNRKFADASSKPEAHQDVCCFAWRNPSIKIERVVVVLDENAASL